MILGKEDEKRATLERYDYDLTRFRKLRQGGRRAANADVIAKSDIPDLVDTAVRCRRAPNATGCGRSPRTTPANMQRPRST